MGGDQGVGRAGSRDIVRDLGSRIHSYPAEQGVPDRDASWEANRLKVAGLILPRCRGHREIISWSSRLARA